MGAGRWSSGEERDPCDDTGPIPALSHGDLDRDDDLADPGEGEGGEEVADEDDVTPAFDELAAELEGPSDDELEPRTGAQAAAPSPPLTGPGATTRIDPLAETGDPDALALAASVPGPVSASGVTDRVSPPDTTAAVAGLPVGRPPASARQGSRPALDEGRPPPPRTPPRTGAPTPARLRALTALAAALPPLVVLALVALGLPQAALRQRGGHDRLEPNDGFTQARSLPPGTTDDLSCGGADVDWFELDVPPGQAVVVQVTPAPVGPGGASLHTLDGRRVAAAGPGESRLVHLAAEPAALKLRLCVWGTRPDYAVSVALAPFGARFEPNDDVAGAAPVGPGRLRAIECDGEDWFRVEVPAHHAVRARLEDAPPELTLGWASDAVAPLTSGREVGARALGVDRVAWLRVAGAPGSYDLVVELEPAAPVVGPDAWRLEPGEYPRLQSNVQDEWRLEAVQGRVLELAVREQGASWNLQVELLDGAWQPVNAATSRRVEGGAAVTRLVYAAPRDEELVLRLTGSPTEYGLELRRSPAATPAQAPPAASAAPLPGGARALGPGVHADQVVSGEAWYSIDVAAGQRLTATAELSRAGASLNVDLLDDLGQVVAQGVTGVGLEQAEHVAERAGRLFVRVSTYTREQFTLSIALDGSTAPAALPLGRHEGLECAGNVYFSVAVPGGRRLVVEITFPSAEGDLDLQLLAEGAEVARSESLEDRERVDHLAVVDETLTLRVYNARNRFDAEVRFEDP